jgi:ABC-type Na+ transport system ATPase subunit NatA
MLKDRLTAENNLKVAQMMLDEISEDGEVEERQDEVDELLDFIIRMKRTLEELSD